jgi:transposase
MQLTDFVRGVPDDLWAVFEPILPPVVWQGNGRKPYGNRQCLHALLYVLAAGIAWEMMPLGFPSYKTVQRRLKLWLQRDLFHQAWQQLARRYEQFNGINWDQLLLDGSKKPSKKGVKKQALRR